MPRIVRSIQSYHNNLQNNYHGSTYLQNTNTFHSLQNSNTNINKPFLNVGMIQNIYNSPQNFNLRQEEPKNLPTNHFYHSSPKYGSTRYTASLVSGKMHKLTKNN
jgi:hypothetical protein